jgi:enolase
MSDARILSVLARQIIDCSGRPLVEVDVYTTGGRLGRGSSPTGGSVGRHEAVVLRDDDPAHYSGMSVRKAVAAVTDIIAPTLLGLDVTRQDEIDRILLELDGTETKSRLGGNAIFSTSVACLRAAAAVENVPLYEHIAGGAIRTVPVPSFNMINGGKRPTLVQAFNEFIVVPDRAETIEEAVEIAVKLYKRIGKVVGRYLKAEPAIGGSYGWSAPSEDPTVVLSLMAEAIAEEGYSSKCSLALDCASSQMYDAATGRYYLNGKQVSSRDLVDYAAELSDRFDLMFIEDLLDEDDWEGYRLIPGRMPRTNIVGDDLTVTSRSRLTRAIEGGYLDGFVFKPNQVGTISEALDAYRLARAHGVAAIPSGRSGGVVDDVIMDLAIGLQVSLIKNGCPRSGERIEKLNNLMRASQLNGDCPMADLSRWAKFAAAPSGTNAFIEPTKAVERKS